MHLSRLPSGSWRAIVQHGGTKRSTTATTKREAQRRGARLYIEMGGSPGVESMSVADLLDVHLDAQAIALSTLTQYRNVRATHLPPAFEARMVHTVNPVVIDALYRQLDEADVSAHQVRKLHSLLSGAFRRAVRLGLVVVNPCRDAELPREPTPRTRTPDTIEARKLLIACDEISPAFGLFCRIAAQTGARRGEVLGLQRGDIEGGQITFVRAIATHKGAAYVAPPKTGVRGIRNVAISDSLAARIDAHTTAQDLEALELGGDLGPEAWLFSEDQRQPWYPSTPTHWWARARHAAGVETVRLHDLRHYVATELFAAGFDEQTAMRRLGHTNPVTTGKRYATSRPARDRLAAEHLERELGA